MRKTLQVWILSLLPFIYFAQNNVGSGNALNFNITDRVDLPNAYSTMNLPVSIAFWIKPNVSNSPAMIFSSSTLIPTYNGWWVQLLAGNSISIAFGDGAGGSNSSFRRSAAATLPSFQPNEWCHITGVIRGAIDMDLYCNGVPLAVSYAGSGGAISTTSNPGAINALVNNSPLRLNAQLDEMSIWNRALSATEIRDLMCAKLSGTEPGLEGYYRFDATAGTTLTDFSTNTNTGTVVGANFVASSAPVGDRSTWSYSPGAPVVGFSPALDSVGILPTGTGGEGAHLYFVDQLPTNPPATTIPPSVNHYVGVFMADGQRSFDLAYLPAPPNNTPNSFGLVRRGNNAAPLWTVTAPRNTPIIFLPGRSSQEQYVLSSFCSAVNVLPNDTVVCVSLTVTLPPSYANVVWTNNTTGNTTSFTSTGLAGFTATVNNCPVGDTTFVTIFDPSALDILPTDTLICNGTRADLNAYNSSAIAYQWSNGASDSATRIFTPGIYWVRVFFPGNCSFRDSVNVTFSDPTEPVEDDEFKYCEGNPVEFSLDPLIFASAAWSNNTSGLQTTYTVTGTHWVLAQKLDGCTVSDTFLIKPAVAFDSLSIFSDTVFCVGESYLLRAPDSLDVIWPNGSDSTYLITKTQTVRVELSDGCTEATEFFDVEETSCECDVVMPNAFTPNGDGLNDIFKPVTKCEYIRYELRIVDRWGGEVFYTETPGLGFDGTLNGEDLPGGTFIYKFNYNNGITEGTRTGALVLLR
jgi:gliding motility-associated-like protein